MAQAKPLPPFTSFERILDSANFSIIATNTEGVIVFFNQTAERWLGWSAAEVIGVQTSALFHDEGEIERRAAELSIVMGYPVKADFTVFSAALGPGQNDEREWTYIRKDGTRFPVKLSVSAACNAQGKIENYVGIAADLSSYYQQENEFRELFNNSVNGLMIFDEKWRLVEINDVACRMYGWGRTTFLSMDEGLKFDFQRFRELTIKGSGITTDFSGEFEESRADGSMFTAEMTGIWVDWRHGRYLMVMVSDISARKHQEQLNRLMEQRYRNLVEQAVDSLLLLDLDANRFIDANANAERLLGYTHEELLQAGPELLYPLKPEAGRPGSAKAFESFLKAVAGESVFFEHEYETRSHSLIPCETRISRMPSERGIVLRISLLDISERKAWEWRLMSLNAELERRVEERTDALRRTNNDLSEALEHVQRVQEEIVRQEKLAELGALVAGITHEISSPIGNALLAAGGLQEQMGRIRDELNRGVLSRARLDDFLGNYAQSSTIIELNLRRANDLIATFKQLAVDQSSDQRRLFDLRLICEEVCTAFHPQLKRSAINTEIEVPDGIRLDSFPGALGQVLGNLVQNSIVHAFGDRQAPFMSGKPTVRFSLESTSEQEIVLVFSDNGRGMDDDVKAMAFDPFFSTRIGKGGSGLGLHLVRTLMESRLGGHLVLETAPGQGVLFHLTLPIKAPEISENSDR